MMQVKCWMCHRDAVEYIKDLNESFLSVGKPPLPSSTKISFHKGDMSMDYAAPRYLCDTCYTACWMVSDDQGCITRDELVSDVRFQSTHVKSNNFEEVDATPTGRIDIDIFTSVPDLVQSNADRRLIQYVIKVKLSGKEKVAVDVVVAEGVALGLKPARVNEIISKLKKAGEIYEPSHGFLKEA